MALGAEQLEIAKSDWVLLTLTHTMTVVQFPAITVKSWQAFNRIRQYSSLSQLDWVVLIEVATRWDVGGIRRTRWPSYQTCCLS